MMQATGHGKRYPETTIERRRRLLRRLHAVAAEACERGGLDIEPHALARQACGVASLADAGEAAILRGIRILDRPPNAQRKQAPRNAQRKQAPRNAQREQSPRNVQRKQAPNPRRRRARPSFPGVIKLPTPAQMRLISRLLNRLGWPASTVSLRLGGKWFYLSLPDGRRWERADGMTATEAGEAINTLIGECKRLRV